MLNNGIAALPWEHNKRTQKTKTLGAEAEAYGSNRPRERPTQSSRGNLEVVGIELMTQLMANAAERQRLQREEG